MKHKILEVIDLKKYFPIHKGIFRRHVGDVKAVDGISFTLHRGEIVALVGESGSGKSTAGLTSIHLLEPTSGSICFLGRDLCAISKKERLLQRRKAQVIFQDPLSSLSPRKSVLDNIGEALLYHGLVKSEEEQIQRVLELLQKIGLPAEALYKYPHEFSGGQQQRISIGRALALRPELIICDEVVSALDLSIQAQILNLLYELKEAYQLSYLFISHDLSIVRHFADRVLVMYQGKIVESGETAEIFSDPKHPYTQKLFKSLPKSYSSGSPKSINNLSRSSRSE